MKKNLTPKKHKMSIFLLLALSIFPQSAFGDFVIYDDQFDDVVVYKIVDSKDVQQEKAQRKQEMKVLRQSLSFTPIQQTQNIANQVDFSNRTNIRYRQVNQDTPSYQGQNNNININNSNNNNKNVNITNLNNKRLIGEEIVNSNSLANNTSNSVIVKDRNNSSNLANSTNNNNNRVNVSSNANVNTINTSNQSLNTNNQNSNLNQNVKIKLQHLDPDFSNYGINNQDIAQQRKFNALEFEKQQKVLMEQQQKNQKDVPLIEKAIDIDKKIDNFFN